MVQPDEHLVERTLAGDLEGFGELHRRYFERMVGVVSGILPDRLQAEDTVQSAYMSALKALPNLADRDRFYPWLRRIAVNRAIEEKRRSARQSRLHANWMESEVAPVTGLKTIPEVLEKLNQEERAERVHASLDLLPEGMRAAIVLRFFDNLSMREIAEVLGCEEVTARTQVFRGLQKLGRALRDLAPGNQEQV